MIIKKGNICIRKGKNDLEAVENTMNIQMYCSGAYLQKKRANQLRSP